MSNRSLGAGWKSEGSFGAAGKLVKDYLCFVCDAMLALERVMESSSSVAVSLVSGLGESSSVVPVHCIFLWDFFSTFANPSLHLIPFPVDRSSFNRLSLGIMMFFEHGIFNQSASTKLPEQIGTSPANAFLP